MQFAWGSILTLVSRMGSAVLWLVVSILLARALSVRDLGIYVATIIVAQGIGAIVASYASATGYFVSNQKLDPGEVAANGLFLGALTGGTCFAVALIVWLVSRDTWILIVGASLLPMVGTHALSGVFLGQNRILLYNAGVQGQAVATAMVFTAWILLPVEHTAGTALAAWLAAQYLSAAFLLPWTGNAWRWILVHGLNWPLIRAIFTFGGVIGLAGALSYFNYRVDQLLVSGLDSAAAAGVYSRAVVVAEGLWLLSTSLAIASYATIGAASRSEAARLTAAATRHTIYLAGLGVAAVSIVAPLLLEILFGGRYTAASTSLRILCVGTAFFAPQSLLSNYFTVQLGKPWLPILVTCVSLTVNIALCIVLVPRVGFVGGAWATTASYTAAGLFSFAAFLRLSDARLNDLWRPRKADVALYLQVAQRTYSRVRHWRTAAGTQV